MDKPVLELEDILGPRDEQLLHRLSECEPAVLDDIANYHLSRVGCATTDTAATRLLSVAVQAAFEKAIDEAKVIHASSRGILSAGTARTDKGLAAMYRNNHQSRGPSGEVSAASTGAACGIEEVRELDVDSLCKALQRNGTLPVGPSFDLLLQPLGPESDNTASLRGFTLVLDSSKHLQFPGILIPRQLTRILGGYPQQTQRNLTSATHALRLLNHIGDTIRGQCPVSQRSIAQL